MKATKPEPGSLGVVIADFDAKAIDAKTAAEIRKLTYRHKLLIFQDQELSKTEYLDFARKLGRPQVYFQSHYPHPEHPEFFVSSNVPEGGKKVGVAGTGRFWHSDYSFFDEPLSTTLVYPQVVPKSRRETVYIDMQRIWQDLPAELRSWVDGARGFHEATWYYKVQPWDVDRAIADLVKEFRELSPGAEHPMVIRHPVTGQRSLYASEGFTTSVIGMTHEESQARLAELFEFVGREEHWRPHAWKAGEILYWDNRQLIHQASESEPCEPSVSYRIGVYDDLPFYLEEPS